MKRLSDKQNSLLVEALRRFTRFNEYGSKKPITEAWTGLGTATEYAPCVKAGLMTCATRPTPGHMTWWKLTTKGAQIVSFWLGQGHDYRTIENGGYPDTNIPEGLMR